MKKYSLVINGNPYEVKIDDVNEASTLAHVTVNGVKYDVQIEGGKAAATKKPQVVAVPQAATSISVTPQTPIATKPAAPVAAAGGTKVTCPLPGTVLSINVKEGDTVAAGQTLLVLEAMKMENNIDAERGGVVKSINVQAGATVMEGEVLLVIE
jgi:biotin carboxyl carrier protein